MGSELSPVAESGFSAFQSTKLSPLDIPINTLSCIFSPRNQLNTEKTVLSSHSKRRSKLVSKTDYRLCRSKVLQNSPRGAFCNTFDLHWATNYH